LDQECPYAEAFGLYTEPSYVPEVDYVKKEEDVYYVKLKNEIVHVLIVKNDASIYEVERILGSEDNPNGDLCICIQFLGMKLEIDAEECPQISEMRSYLDRFVAAHLKSKLNHDNMDQ
jgi:hypothetical protein